MPRPQRVVTLREMRGSRPGRVLLATSDPAVVRAVERAMARRLDPDCRKETRAEPSRPEPTEPTRRKETGRRNPSQADVD